MAAASRQRTEERSSVMPDPGSKAGREGIKMRIEKREGRNAWGEYEDYIAIDDSGIKIRFDLEELNSGDEFKLQAEGLHWAKYDESGERIRQGSDWCTVPTAEELAAMDAVAKHLNAYRKNREIRYIRFGKLPKGGKSKNHATGESEEGVSCYEALYNPFTRAWELAGSALSAAAIAGAFGIYDSVWLLSGEVVGIGSDGEPLLSGAKAETELVYDRMAQGYKPIKSR